MPGVKGHPRTENGDRSDDDDAGNGQSGPIAAPRYAGLRRPRGPIRKPVPVVAEPAFRRAGVVRRAAVPAGRLELWLGARLAHGVVPTGLEGAGTSAVSAGAASRRAYSAAIDFTRRITWPWMIPLIASAVQKDELVVPRHADVTPTLDPDRPSQQPDDSRAGRRSSRTRRAGAGTASVARAGIKKNPITSGLFGPSATISRSVKSITSRPVATNLSAAGMRCRRSQRCTPTPSKTQAAAIAVTVWWKALVADLRELDESQIHAVVVDQLDGVKRGDGRQAEQVGPRLPLVFLPSAHDVPGAVVGPSKRSRGGGGCGDGADDGGLPSKGGRAGIYAIPPIVTRDGGAIAAGAGSRAAAVSR